MSVYQPPVDRFFESSSEDDYCFDLWFTSNAWKTKSPVSWNNDDIIFWITSVAREMDMCPTELPADLFGHFDGYRLSKLTEAEFKNIDCKYGGLLYAQLQKELNRETRQVRCHQVESDDITQYHNSWYSESQAWKEKRLKSWTSTDIIHWITSLARENNVCPTELPGEQCSDLDGFQLSNLTKDEFMRMDYKYGGVLFDNVQDILVKECDPIQTECHREQNLVDLNDREGESSSTEEDEVHTTRKNGHCRRRISSKNTNKTEKFGPVWQFLRDLLQNPEYCPKLIAWEDPSEGTFRFVQKEVVAKMWGSRNGNPNMSYEKLTRAMRYHYRTSRVLEPVPRKKRVYKFGPNATGWKIDNPV